MRANQRRPCIAISVAPPRSRRQGVAFFSPPARRAVKLLFVRRALLPLLMLALAGCDASAAPHRSGEIKASAPVAKPVFLKGQLHAHTGSSADSDTPPEEAAAWYAAHGFDFVVFTDHNRVTEVTPPSGMLVLRGVELTQNLRRCVPEIEPGAPCLLHVNALFVRPEGDLVRFDPLEVPDRTALYGRAVDRAIAMGGVAQLNHPNFRRGADLDVILALSRRGLSLMEIANQAVDSDNEGDERHPSTEALWDGALSRGARIFATATDDAHHYNDAARAEARGETAYTGDRGFVMVRADKTEASIRAAVVAGDFYASTGVLLDRLDLSREAISLAARPAGAPYVFEVIAGGRVVERSEGTELYFNPKRAPGEAWMRVRVTDRAGRRAYTQPVWTG
jgi:hypothetical protein